MVATKPARSHPQTLAAAASLEAHYYRRATCRICKAADLNSFLDFGLMPLANSFRRAADGDDNRRFPLSCMYCGRCGLVQVPEVVDPSILFTRYNYFSSASEPMVDHFRRQADLIRHEYLTDPSCLLCEIGSNDGTFLQNLVGLCRVVGIDPADNVDAIAAQRGVTAVNGFFNSTTAANLRDLYGPAKVIFTANCFAHIDDLDEVMDGVINLLSEDGVFVFENHRFAHMLRTACFDQIYHEHLCYYTLRPIEQLMQRFGMRLIDVRLIPTQGESFQIHCARRGSGYEERPTVQRIRDDESELGLDEPATYERFARAVAQRRDELKTLLNDLKAAGKRIVGYGAPGKATILLNAMGIDADVIDYAVDSTSLKQGCVIPGTAIPIQPPEVLQSDSPDYLLLLAWNYADTILQRESSLRERGIKFIVPAPTLRIV